MIVSISEKGGFCEGVKRALKIAENTPNAVVLGDIVNNDQVVSRLENRGVFRVESVEQAAGKTVVISASSAKKSEYELLKNDEG